MSRENWKPVPGYEGRYMVSDAGRVMNARTGRVLKPATVTKGYKRVTLSRPGAGKRTAFIHRLVLAAFTGPCPEGMETRHLNGNPADNRLDNLAWGTSAENSRDMLAHDTHHNGSKRACKRGHLFTGRNLQVDHAGGRHCEACRNARARLTREGIEPTPEAMELAAAWFYRRLVPNPGLARVQMVRERSAADAAAQIIATERHDLGEPAEAYPGELADLADLVHIAKTGERSPDQGANA